MPHAISTARRSRSSARRGSALVLVLVMTMALGALALSAIYLSSSATLAARANARENDLRYRADGAMNMVKSYLNTDPAAVPESSFREFPIPGNQLAGADGFPMTGATVRVWYGETGSTTSDGTSFATIVAEARDPNGGRVVRSMLATRESFAKYAYYSTRETYQGSPISFAAGNVLFGPVWSNDVITISNGTPRASFQDSVWTARTISNAGAATFARGYLENQQPIFLPSTSMLSRLRSIAQRGNLAFDAPTSGNEQTVRMRLEFTAVDLNADGDSTDENEGFVRVYTATASGPTGVQNGMRWLRGDWRFGNNANQQRDFGTNCGDWHRDSTGRTKFYPVWVHRQANFAGHMRNAIVANAVRDGVPVPTGTTLNNQVNAIANETTADIMGRPNARCFLGGDEHLVALERNQVMGGEDSTFTASGLQGQWQAVPGGPDPRLPAGRPDRAYLFPVTRAFDPEVRGVVDVSGTVGVSGVVNGKVTVHTTGHLVLLDDITYAVPPGGTLPSGEPNCDDILGMVSDRDIVVADNALLTPVDHDDAGGSVERSMTGTPGLTIHGISMAVNTSFRVENHNTGPTTAVPCLGQPRGRGCLNVDGGILQFERGPVGLVGSTGFTKRYAYDRCGASDPPPYFPTTGRFADNRVIEIDPVGFDVSRWFEERQVGN